MGYTYTHVSRAIPAKFMTSQTTGNLLATRPQVKLPSGSSEDATAKRFCVAEFSVNNRSGSEVSTGLAVRLPIALWEAGKWVDSTTTYTDDTTDAQSAATGDFALGTTSTNNDGFCVFADVPFNVVSVLVSTAASGGSPAFAMSYTIAGGTWTTITAATAFSVPLFTSTGEQLVWFATPQDWAVSESGHGTGVPTGMYGLRVRQTTAGSSSGGLASLLVVGRAIYGTEGIADNKVAVITKEGETPMLPQGDALCAVITTTNAQNRADVKYRMRA